MEALKNIGLLSSMPLWLKIAALIIGNLVIIILCWGPRSESDGEKKTEAITTYNNAPGGTMNIGVSPPQQSIRVKYSDRQKVEGRLNDPNQLLNLDNIATMHLFSCGETHVEFLAPSGSLSLPKPEPGKKYPIGGGLNVQTGTNVGIISDVTVFSGGGKPIQFDADHRTKRIVVRGRTFVVHLDQINQFSGGKDPVMQYVFAISEE